MDGGFYPWPAGRPSGGRVQNGAMSTPRAQTVLLWLAVLGGLAFLISFAIVTDEEAIENWASAAEDAISGNDEARLTELLAEDFAYGTRDRAATVTLALRAKRDFGVLSVDIDLTDIRVDGDSATAKARVRATSMGRIWEGHSTYRFTRFEQGWGLSEASELGIPGR